MREILAHYLTQEQLDEVAAVLLKHGHIMVSRRVRPLSFYEMHRDER